MTSLLAILQGDELAGKHVTAPANWNLFLSLFPKFCLGGGGFISSSRQLIESFSLRAHHRSLIGYSLCVLLGGTSQLILGFSRCKERLIHRLNLFRLQFRDPKLRDIHRIPNS